MKLKLFLGCCLGMLTVGCQSTFDRSDYTPPNEVTHIDQQTEQRRIAFDGGIIDIERGEPYIAYPYWRWQIPNVNVGMAICNLAPHFRFSKSLAYWNEDEDVFSKWTEEVGTHVGRALGGQGYNIKQTRQSYFKDKSAYPQAELLLAMRITDLKFNLCYAHSAVLGQDLGRSAGNGEVTVEWEIWDGVRELLLGSYTTKGYGQADDLVPGGDKSVFVYAIRDAAANLGRTQWFYDMMTTPDPVDLLPVTQYDKLILPNAEKEYQKPIQKRYTFIRRAAISVRAEGNKYNSGFFITRGGYALTTAKAVGDAEYVQVMDVNRAKYRAKVLRVDYRRDVALLHAEITDNRAFPIAKETFPEALDEVYAIGTPFHNSYRATITKGTISTNRYNVTKGIGFIQASIPTAPGYTGGPLTDAYGNVIGMSVSISEDGNETNFSRFIPIHDALRALNIELEKDTFK